MNHVHYDIQVDSIPPSLFSSSKIESLLAFKVTSQKFGKENDIIERHMKLTRETTFSKIDHSSHLEIFGTSTQADTTALSGSSGAHIPTIAPMVDVTVEQVKIAHSEVEIDETYMSPPELVKKSSYNVVEDFTVRQEKLDRMVERTSQAVDVCHFYLEMVDWDFDKAVEMFGSLTSGS